MPANGATNMPMVMRPKRATAPPKPAAIMPVTPARVECRATRHNTLAASIKMAIAAHVSSARVNPGSSWKAVVGLATAEPGPLVWPELQWYLVTRTKKLNQKRYAPKSRSNSKATCRDRGFQVFGARDRTDLSEVSAAGAGAVTNRPLFHELRPSDY
jgi:hypothetical protein